MVVEGNNWLAVDILVVVVEGFVEYIVQYSIESGVVVVLQVFVGTHLFGRIVEDFDRKAGRMDFEHNSCRFGRAGVVVVDFDSIDYSIGDTARSLQQLLTEHKLWSKLTITYRLHISGESGKSLLVMLLKALLYVEAYSHVVLKPHQSFQGDVCWAQF